MGVLSGFWVPLLPLSAAGVLFWACFLRVCLYPRKSKPRNPNWHFFEEKGKLQISEPLHNLGQILQMVSPVIRKHDNVVRID